MFSCLFSSAEFVDSVCQLFPQNFGVVAAIDGKFFEKIKMSDSCGSFKFLCEQLQFLAYFFSRLPHENRIFIVDIFRNSYFMRFSWVS